MESLDWHRIALIDTDRYPSFARSMFWNVELSACDGMGLDWMALLGYQIVFFSF